MIPKRIIIEAKVLAVVGDEMSKVSKRETGGALVGYFHDGELVVTDASGPGPCAKLEEYGVVIDGKYAAHFCGEACRRSSGRDDYVGDWHCHPGMSLKPSHSDHDAMTTMSESKESPTRHPVSLIWSKVSGKVRGFCYDPRSRKLRGIKVRTRRVRKRLLKAIASAFLYRFSF